MAGANGGWGAPDPIQRDQQRRDLSDALDWRCLQWKDGCMYQGLEAGGSLESHGVVSWPVRRERYEGQLWRSAPHGAGVYRWRDGTLYRGEWYDGHMHGCGVLIWKDEHGDIQAQAGRFFGDEYVGPVGSCSSAAAHEAALEADVAAARARSFETALGRQQRGASTYPSPGNAAAAAAAAAAGSNTKGAAAGRGGGGWWSWLNRGSPHAEPGVSSRPAAGARSAGVPAGVAGTTPTAVTRNGGEEGRWLWAARAGGGRLGGGGAGAGGVPSGFMTGIGPGAAGGGRLGVVAAPYGEGAQGASGSKSRNEGSTNSSGGSGGGLRWGSIARSQQQQQQQQHFTARAGQGLGNRGGGVAAAGGGGNTQEQGQAQGQGQGQGLLPEQQRQLEALLAGSLLPGLAGQAGKPLGQGTDRG